MEQHHRAILRTNRTNLIENIANPRDVVEKLYQKNVFTESMKQEVEAEKTQYRQLGNILDTVAKRGGTAFNKFYDCLIETGNGDAADFLRPALQGAHQHHDGAGDKGYDLQQDWPNEEILGAEIYVKPCDMKSDLVRQNWISPDVYSMKKRCRGRCLILSNRRFYGPLKKDKEGIMRCVLSTRDGTEKDEADLKQLFEQLHFDVITHKDLTVQDIHEELLREAAHLDQQQAECFVCVICSHGTKSGIYGTDGGIIPIEKVVTCFDGEHCKALQSKPKLFFIQACQGDIADRPVANETVDGGQDLSQLLRNVHISENGDQPDASTEDDLTNVPPIPTKSDILIACATHPGYVSFRHVHYGSWFIQAVISVFQMSACKVDILGLLTLVNCLVARGRTALGQTGPRDAMQASMFTSSLNRNFFFFPGFFADTET